MGATPKMNRSAKGGERSSLHYEGEGVLIHPPHQGVCGWHGTEEQCVTSGGLAGSPGGTGVSKLISEIEMASDALSVDGRLFSTTSAAKAARPGNGGGSGPGKAAGEGGREEREDQMSKGGEVDHTSSTSAQRSRIRR
jgi:hypothetical protein